MELKVRNVNQAFKQLVQIFHSGGCHPDHSSHDVQVVKKSSGNGDVLMIDEPVLITYTNPLERCLFNEARDVNPFSVIYESLYCLAGRNDVAPLTYYSKRMSELSDDGKTINESYGFRWKRSKATSPAKGASVYHDGEDFYDKSVRVKAINQLEFIVNHLKAKPDSRRAVLQMWNVEDDLLNIGGGTICPTCNGNWTLELATKLDENPLQPCPNCGGNPMSPYWDTVNNRPFESKDVCCNLSVMFSLRESVGQNLTFKEERCNPLVPIPGTASIPPRKVLDITVISRSNDLVWGLTNVNYIQFSILAEYVAAHLGVQVGLYRHFTNNLHVYEKTWEPEKWLADETPDYYTNANLSKGNLSTEQQSILWGRDFSKSIPLIQSPEVFDKEVIDFVEHHSRLQQMPKQFTESFLQDVARPMCNAFHCYKANAIQGALNWLQECEADDWRLVSENWIKRRI